MKKIMIELIIVIIGVFVFAVETSLPDGSVYYGRAPLKTPLKKK